MTETEEPLVYTTKGNLPVASLAYSVEWQETPEYTKLVETYKLGDEVVKQSAHVLTRQTLTVGATINPPS